MNSTRSNARSRMFYPSDRARSVASATLYVGDCLPVMRKLYRRFQRYDLCIADPPFNIGHDYDGNGSDTMPEPEYRRFTAAWLTGATALLRDGGSMFIHCHDEIVGQIAETLRGLGMVYRNWIILHQQFGQYTEAKFIRSKFHLLYYVKPPTDRLTWQVKSVLEPSTRLKMGDKRVSKARFKGMRPFFDVWSGPLLGRVQGNDRERRSKHPNQLREMYIARIVRAASLPGDTVFTPFCGSGTEMTVARWLDRNAVGIELRPALAASAWKRIGKGPVRDIHGPLATEPYLKAHG